MHIVKSSTEGKRTEENESQLFRARNDSESGDMLNVHADQILGMQKDGNEGNKADPNVDVDSCECMRMYAGMHVFMNA
eukprot:5810668-Karenia_brevis.AAC.1